MFFRNKDCTKLLEYVAHGNQLDAENLIKLKPELLNINGNVKDYSGRTFEDITALQYAIWSYDWRMRDMILKYLDKAEAQRQTNLVQSKGIDYFIPESLIRVKEFDQKGQEIPFNTKDKMIYVKESHFDLDSYILKLKKYLMLWDWDDYYENWSKGKAYWCKVIGGAQRLLPACIAQEYCQRGDDSQDSLQGNDLSQPEFDRVFNYYDPSSPANGRWFPLDNSTMGINIAVVGYNVFSTAYGHFVLDIYVDDARLDKMPGTTAVENDIKGLCALREVLNKKFNIKKPTYEARWDLITYQQNNVEIGQASRINNFKT